MDSPKNPFFAVSNALFSVKKSAIHLFISSAKKHKKLYLFMGRANKNIPAHIIKGHFYAAISD